MKYMKFMNLIEFRIVYHSISNHTFTQDVYMFFFSPWAESLQDHLQSPWCGHPVFSEPKTPRGWAF